MDFKQMKERYGLTLTGQPAASYYNIKLDFCDVIIMVIPLNQIDVGERAMVVWIASEDSMAIRLNDLGFIPEGEIQCVLKGRRGGMRAYLVRNAVIGLREMNIKEVYVKRLEKAEE